MHVNRMPHAHRMPRLSHEVPSWPKGIQFAGILEVTLVLWDDELQFGPRENKSSRMIFGSICWHFLLAFVFFLGWYSGIELVD